MMNGVLRLSFIVHSSSLRLTLFLKHILYWIHRVPCLVARLESLCPLRI